MALESGDYVAYVNFEKVVCTKSGMGSKVLGKKCTITVETRCSFAKYHLSYLLSTHTAQYRSTLLDFDKTIVESRYIPCF